MKFIAGTSADRLSQALYDSGMIQNPPSDVGRIVIDLKPGEPAVIYVKLFMDTDAVDVLLESGLALAGFDDE